ncbi:MAG: phosphocholine cytidylyltransferase family protein [Deltaproteobacteria bacterium]
MTATVGVILAAGVGSRLRPLTDDRPKCLLSVGDETIVHRMTRLLAAAGVTRLVVSTGYLEDALRGALASAPLPVSFVSNPDYASTQNMVSLTRALERVGDEEAFVKLDGDVLFQLDVMTRMLAGSGDARVAVDGSGTLGAEEMKVRVHNGRVVAFGKGLDPATADGESIGIEWFAPAAARKVREAMSAAMKAGRTGVYYEDVYNDVLGDLHMETRRVEPGEWMEVDDVEDLALARQRFAAAP